MATAVIVASLALMGAVQDTIDPIDLFFPPEARAVARCIRANENRSGDPYAIGALGERGDFQIHPVHSWRFKGGFDDAFNRYINTYVAAQIYEEQGFTPWTTFPNCANAVR